MEVSKIKCCSLFVVFSSLLLFNSTPLSGGKVKTLKNLCIKFIKEKQIPKLVSDYLKNEKNIDQIVGFLTQFYKENTQELFLEFFDYFLRINGHQVNLSDLRFLLDKKQVDKKKNSSLSCCEIPNLSIISKIPTAYCRKILRNEIIKISISLAKNLPGNLAFFIVKIIAHCPELFWNGEKSIAEYAKDCGLENEKIDGYLTKNSRENLKRLERLIESDQQQEISEDSFKNIEDSFKNIDVNLPLCDDGSTFLHSAVCMVGYLAEKRVEEAKKIATNILTELNFQSEEAIKKIDTLEKEKIGIVKLLLKCGADIDAKGFRDFTPLYWVVEKEKIDIVTFLIENGADVNARAFDWMGLACSPLREALNKRVDFLEKFFHLVHEKYDGDFLLAAIEKDNIGLVNNFLEWGADVNCISTENGMAPLIWAVYKGNINIVNLLLKYSADTEIKDKQGNTPLSTAKKFGNGEMVSIIEQNKSN